MAKKQKILIVDDESTNLQVLRQTLQDDYELAFSKSGQTAIEIALDQAPDLILLDIMMPEVTGYDVLEALKSFPKTAKIPVIFVTAISDFNSEAKGLELGAVDYISKPFSPAIVRARVKTHLSLTDVNQLKSAQLEMLRRLGQAAEFKDFETGLHVVRMSHYSKILGLAAGMSEDEAEELYNAAPMHDLGKIGIPDQILLKKGKLDDQEWEVMRNHPFIGFSILSGSQCSLLKLAAEIAHTHHEKWNGEGYPRQLKGNDIPLAGRIVALTDVFDALTTARPYKAAWSVDSAIDYIQQQSGQHFDPNLVDLFIQSMPKILEIRSNWSEDSAPTTH